MSWYLFANFCIYTHLTNAIRMYCILFYKYCYFFNCMCYFALQWKTEQTDQELQLRSQCRPSLSELCLWSMHESKNRMERSSRQPSLELNLSGQKFPNSVAKKKGVKNSHMPLQLLSLFISTTCESLLISGVTFVLMGHCMTKLYSFQKYSLAY